MSAPTPLSVAQQVAGWGELVDVDGDSEDGAAVRRELARLGRELCERYAR